MHSAESLAQVTTKLLRIVTIMSKTFTSHCKE